MKNLVLILGLLVGFNANSASILEFSGTPQVISASGLDVGVHPDVKVNLPGDMAVDLKLSGSGIRKKSILFIPVNIYVAASYVADPQVFKGKPAIEGIKNSPVRVLKLTMLRALTGPEIRQSFEDALKFNGIDINQTAMANVFSQFNVDANPGDSYTMVSSPKGSLERLIIEFPSKTFAEEGKDLGVEFLKVWFGKPVDSGIEELQKALTGN